MSEKETVVPVLANAAALVVPSGTDVRALARAWFPDADWLREPRGPKAAVAMVGARFRGVVTQADRGAIGLIELGSGEHVVGPLPVGGESLDLWWVTVSARATDGRAEAWARAVAQHAGGGVGTPSMPTIGALVAAVGQATGGPGEDHDEAVRGASKAALRDVAQRGFVRPESTRAGARILYSALLVDAPACFDLLTRHGLRAAVQDRDEVLGNAGEVGYTIVGRTAYDGAVVLRMFRAEVEPPALREIPWREYGPFAYELSWCPVATDGDVIDSIARRRVAPTITRVTAALRELCPGTVLTGDGFFAT